VRKATRGEKSVLNCHPFQYGRWVFAHNGDIPDFDRYRERLRAEVSPNLRRFILGDTDSEVVFFVFLTRLLEAGPLAEARTAEQVVTAWRHASDRVREICDSPESSARCLLTILVTDGSTLVAAHGGKELYWSSYKRRCSDRDTCPSLSAECEAPTESGFVNHCIVSSEPLLGENVWLELSEGDVIGVDANMKIAKSRLDRRALPVVDQAAS
jgi:glutamine amidotransferase